MSGHAAKARACFALAASTTHEGERAAALDRGWHLLTKHGLDPDAFDIPGRTRTARGEEFPGLESVLADVFGACVGCGAVASVGVMCRACSLRAESCACAHGRHGYCLDCEMPMEAMRA